MNAVSAVSEGLRLPIALLAGLAGLAPAAPAGRAGAPSAGEPAAHRVILLDGSASMEHPVVWQEARERVEKLLAEVGPGRLAALIAFDGEARVEVPLTANRELLSVALWQVVRPDGLTTNPVKALAAAEGLLDAEGGGGEVHLISDFQSAYFASWRPAVRRGLTLVTHPVAVPGDDNHAVGPLRRTAAGRLEVGLRSRFQGEHWIDLPEGVGTAEGVVRVSGPHPELRVTTARLAGDTRAVVVEVLAGDGWGFDDRWIGLEPPSGGEAPEESPERGEGAGGVVVGPGGDRWPRWRLAPLSAQGPAGLYRLEKADGVVYRVIRPDPRESLLGGGPGPAGRLQRRSFHSLTLGAALH